MQIRLSILPPDSVGLSMAQVHAGLTRDDQLRLTDLARTMMAGQPDLLSGQATARPVAPNDRLVAWVATFHPKV